MKSAGNSVVSAVLDVEWMSKISAVCDKTFQTANLKQMAQENVQLTSSNRAF